MDSLIRDRERKRFLDPEDCILCDSLQESLPDHGRGSLAYKFRHRLKEAFEKSDYPDEEWTEENLLERAERVAYSVLSGLVGREAAEGKILVGKKYSEWLKGERYLVISASAKIELDSLSEDKYCFPVTEVFKVFIKHIQFDLGPTDSTGSTQTFNLSVGSTCSNVLVTNNFADSTDPSMTFVTEGDTDRPLLSDLEEHMAVMTIKANEIADEFKRLSAYRETLDDLMRQKQKTLPCDGKIKGPQLRVTRRPMRYRKLR